jgi:hypothetical protein
MRPILRRENPSLSLPDITCRLAEAWNAVSDEVKLSYIQKAARAAEQFNRDNPSKKKKAGKRQKKRRTTPKDPGRNSVRVGMKTEAMTRGESTCSGLTLSLSHNGTTIGIATLPAGCQMLSIEQNDRGGEGMRWKFHVESHVKPAEQKIEIS